MLNASNLSENVIKLLSMSLYGIRRKSEKDLMLYENTNNKVQQKPFEVIIKHVESFFKYSSKKCITKITCHI